MLNKCYYKKGKELDILSEHIKKFNCLQNNFYYNFYRTLLLPYVRETINLCDSIKKTIVTLFGSRYKTKKDRITLISELRKLINELLKNNSEFTYMLISTIIENYKSCHKVLSLYIYKFHVYGILYVIFINEELYTELNGYFNESQYLISLMKKNYSDLNESILKYEKTVIDDLKNLFKKINLFHKDIGYLKFTFDAITTKESVVI